ncbi:outer membrane protein assembly factor BamB family protein [Alteriqipengyuania lutimaris]|uniref:Pyrrolo-quinoline quinone n=1 Tax=Alteriqipengyuania lutimaris TaxID=1538146 RepID=A0A395LP52_9SPHN|nr:PQQ-binding-like beta-propeller repeat protein [Alteriqipengyuania lutimaris]MBB3033170.1 outer membrane protein assembly factor BamB [Alteriqipengyuania lutimaris]RDS78631.1 pyrrolo-quinoline quinone [Alteriqipengyuania lutimaris]
MANFRKTTLRAKGAIPLLLTALVVTGCSGGLFGGGGDKNVTPTVGNRVPVLSRVESGASVDPALAGVSVVLPPARVNSDWAMAGSTPSNSYGHLALGANPTQAWSVQIEGSSSSRRLGAAPIVADGTLYTIDTAGTIHALDAETGARIWEYRADIASDLRGAAFGGGLAVAGNRLFASGGTGKVVALDTANGAEIWSATPAGPLRDSPTLAFNLVLVVTQDNRIIALDQSDGSISWQESGSVAQAGVFGIASPAAGQGTVVAGYSSGELVAYRYENGRVLWSDALARTSISTEVGSISDIDADPIIQDGRVYALGQGGRMAAYELVTGQRIWELNLSGISTPALAGEWLFTLTSDARMLAIARATGKVRWITQLARYRNEEKRKNPIFWTGPVLASNMLYVANSRGELWQLSTGEGSASLLAELDDPVSLPPIVVNNTLYVLDDGGTITAFR